MDRNVADAVPGWKLVVLVALCAMAVFCIGTTLTVLVALAIVNP